METQNNNIEENTASKSFEYRRGRKAMAGTIIVAVGGLLLARELGADIPHWFFTWQMFLIAVGLYVGAKHSFRGFGWLIPIAVGTIFLLDQFFLDINIGKIAWPVVVILIGLAMIFKPRRNRDWNQHYRNRWEKKFGDWDRDHTSSEQTSDNYMDSVTVFGSLKKNIIAKDFKGGESTTVFGGTELNFMQADITGRVTIDLTQVFGGTKIIVPANWSVHTEDLISVFGGVEDKRPIRNDVTDADKVLVLKGTCFFGGIDIKSY